MREAKYCWVFLSLIIIQIDWFVICLVGSSIKYPTLYIYFEIIKSTLVAFFVNHLASAVHFPSQKSSTSKGASGKLYWKTCN